MLLLIGVEGYSTPVGKRDRRDPARSETKEAARRSPTGKRVAWNGNQPPRFAEEPLYINFYNRKATRFIFVNMYHIGVEVHLHQPFLQLFCH